ncbi:MAG: autotransporter outer membrane beta-barrel domain-containing protein [Akkermansia sp.]|nr:autotransporter outer membrane beta-barrel domain-containing protein [Akkermansia sp.]
MGEAILSIEGSSTGEAGDSYFGTHSGALSEIKIADNSKLNLLRNLSTGYEKNNIVVENAKIVIEVDDESTLSVANLANLSTNDNNTTTTVLSLTNNSTAKFGSLTAGSESGNSTAEINIDATCSVEAYDSAKELQVTINHADVNNAGTIKASTVTVNNGGTLSMIGNAAKLNEESVVTVNEGGTLQAAGGDAIDLGENEVSVEEGGAISLKDGSTLSARALTMAAGSTIKLSGGYSSGDALVSSDNLQADGVTVTMDNGMVEYTMENGVIYLTAVFDNSLAEALTVTNWGIATASRTFVNTVRGQRTNTGCIANGRGTAWAAVLGGTSDIGSGDVDLKGAAVGADMKVGEKSSLGVAFGYIDGDAKIPGLSKAEQEGTYVALYGEHGLKKLSATSCLSLDWVAAYGQTETEWESADWEQQSLQLNTRLNWNKKVTDRLCMSVFGGLEYFTSESDRVENAKTGSIQNLRGEIGVGARYVAWGTPASQPVLDEKGATIASARPGCEKLVLHGEIRYMNDMVRSNPVIEQDGLRGSGDNPGRQGMGIEAGATYRISERWSASANYGFNTMEDSKEHRVNVGASYTF